LPAGSGSRRSSKQVTVMDHDRLVCGIATCFDVRSETGIQWSAGQFQGFVDHGMAVPLLFEHEPIIASSGFIPEIGVARRFEPVSYPSRGLLCLAEVKWADGWGDSILRDIRSVLSQQWLPSVWSFSVSALIAEAGEIWIEEVSITRKPAFSDARILACGPDALQTWEFCREMSAATTKAA
jgi:hypothetical protein